MMRSEEVDQQRTKEFKALKRFVGGSLIGSLLLHSMVLSLKTNDRWSLKNIEPTEIAIVPPKPLPSPQPPELPEPETPEPETPEPETPMPPIRPELSSTAEAEQQIRPQPTPALPQAVGTPEGRPDVAANESPLVGSGLAEGEGGFSEGIGLNRSNSPIRGSGGGARRGVPGGDPAAVPESEPVSPPSSAPTPAPESDSEDSSRWAVCRRCPPPDYPRNALQSGLEGRVQVTVDIDRRGRVTGVRLANSSGDAALDRAVLETVQEQWRFENIVGGAEDVPVEVYMTVNGSELHQQAEAWGEQTAVEVPTTGFSPAANLDSTVPVTESVPETPVTPNPADQPTSTPDSSEAAAEPEIEPVETMLETPLEDVEITELLLEEESVETILEAPVEDTPVDIVEDIEVAEPLLGVELILEMPAETPVEQ